ncbi:unnamed protein product [Penicillium roqueforti FM164]|uniref:Genomic scaffold, ProqFM164S01 n=1 Tax=Penicillium roqueforti (strain FM164) TaxID=1365484 RepID=W6PXG3_PENRF|nr:unnamed protein product [Penicillium roqueforti FM164]
MSPGRAANRLIINKPQQSNANGTSGAYTSQTVRKYEKTGHITFERQPFVFQRRCRLAGRSAGVSARTAKGPGVQWGWDGRP